MARRGGFRWMPSWMRYGIAILVLGYFVVVGLWNLINPNVMAGFLRNFLDMFPDRLRSTVSRISGLVMSAGAFAAMAFLTDGFGGRMYPGSSADRYLAESDFEPQADPQRVEELEAALNALGTGWRFEVDPWDGQVMAIDPSGSGRTITPDWPTDDDPTPAPIIARQLCTILGIRIPTDAESTPAVAATTSAATATTPVNAPPADRTSSPVSPADADDDSDPWGSDPASPPDVDPATRDLKLSQADIFVKSAGERWNRGDYDGALGLADQAYQIRLIHLGAEHPKTLEVLGMLNAARRQVEGAAGSATP